MKNRLEVILLLMKIDRIKFHLVNGKPFKVSISDIFYMEKKLEFLFKVSFHQWFIHNRRAHLSS